jgi:tRNA U34 5-carboxymethylaminomethyl modifying enzyme MnmG/GidA
MRVIFIKELEIVDRMKKMEDREINPDFDYHTLLSLSKEAREKLTSHQTTHFRVRHHAFRACHRQISQ